MEKSMEDLSACRMEEKQLLRLNMQGQQCRESSYLMQRLEQLLLLQFRYLDRQLKRSLQHTCLCS